MKKLASKFRKKQPEEPAGRITTDTLAEHRERVLAGGRKFKYPVQYQRHKLVINALIIGVAAVVLLIALGWYLLYVAKNTSEFMYRVTKVVPAPVAIVEGEQVRYSDYLMKYRSAAHYLIEKEQIDVNSESGKRQLGYVKEQAMNDAIADAYAAKLARELDISVSDAELETYLTEQRQAGGDEVSEATYNAVIRDYYGWSPQEYRDAMKQKLLRQKVAYAVDAHAEEVAKSVEAKVKAGNTNLEAIARDLNKESADEAIFTKAEWVPKNNQDGGLAETAVKLKKGQVSVRIQTPSGGGYYYVKLIDSNDSDVRYESLFIPLKTFSAKLESLEKDEKLTYFITLENLIEESETTEAEQVN